jgi:hypothetical protein
MDEGIGVYALDGHRRRKGVLGAAQELGSRHDQHRAKALAAALHRIAHGLVEPGRSGAGQGKQAIDSPFYPVDGRLQLGKGFHSGRIERKGRGAAENKLAKAVA